MFFGHVHGGFLSEGIDSAFRQSKWSVARLISNISLSY